MEDHWTIENGEVAEGIPENVRFEGKLEDDETPDLSYLGDYRADLLERRFVKGKRAVPAYYVDRYQGALIEERTGKVLVSDLTKEHDHDHCHYFVPGNQPSEKGWAHVKPKSIRESYAHNSSELRRYGLRTDLKTSAAMTRVLDLYYMVRDYERMEDYERGDWNCRGLVVTMHVGEAEVSHDSCWGYESDSGEEYFRSTALKFAQGLWSDRNRYSEQHRQIAETLAA